LRIVTGGPSKLLGGNAQVSAAVWTALVLSPLVTLLGLVLAAVDRSLPWLVVSAVAAGMCAVVLVLVVKVRRYERKRGPRLQKEVVLGPLRTGPKGLSAEQRLDSAVGVPTKPALHDAGARTPRVTVVVACFNDAHLLGAALHSLQRQTISDWECVVVDDGSTDESSDVALLFAERDDRFSVVVHDRNRGLSAARNTGIARARGEFVTFLDSDDFLYEGALEARLDGLPDEPACVGAYCDWHSVAEDMGYAPAADVKPGRKLDVHLITVGFDVPFIASAPIVRTDVLRACGGFDETLRTAEDAELWARLLRGGVWFSYVPYVGVAYRQRSGSMVRRSPLGHLDVITEVTDRLSESWEGWPGAPIPLTAPLGDYLEHLALLPRRLNFLALHVALLGPDGVDSRHLPMPELRALPDYPARVRDQAERALRRIGRRSEREVAALTKRLLELAPPVTPPVPELPAAPAPEVRGRVISRGVRRLDVASLHGDAPVFLLAPLSRYHVTEVGPLLTTLRERGVRAEAYLPPEAPVTCARELAAYVDCVYVGDPKNLGGAPLLGAFVLNDWSPNVQSLLAAVRNAGGVSFAKVEGVQDFEDVDTGRVRRPYRHADVVLAQGRNDVVALPGRDVHVVGSSRLERLWLGEAVRADHERVLINFNFTYGVLTDKQDEWIWAAVEGARALGVDYEISLHPAQKNVPDHPAVMAHVSVDPFSHALRRSGVLISRFSTVIYEAMAVGVPAIYLNSHGEKVPTFQDPGGAFLKVTGTDLEKAVAEAMSWRGSYRSRAEAFFRDQVDIDPARTSEERSADVIVSMLGL
jgi:GT2 family glycosyltransferase